MKLIWFSHFVPFPPRGGNLQRSFNLIRQMSKTHEITLIALNLLSEPPQQLSSYTEELKRYCENVEIWELSHPWKGARWWAGLLWSPMFKYPFSCRVLFSGRNLFRWKQVLEANPDALVHFDSIDLALFASAAGDHRKILNHHNCESAMLYRQVENERNSVKKTYLRLQASKLAQLEKSLCGTVDANTVVSEPDLRLLQANQPNAHIHVVENGVDTEYFKPMDVEEEPGSLIFTGWLGWYANISAMRFFVGEVWPRLKERVPGVRLYLAGRNPPDSVLQWMKEDPNIVVVSNPADMRPFLARAAVVICPILEGGGTRLKILDAMAMAKPLITTTVGCEGLRVEHGHHLLIADTPEEFVEGILQLLKDKGRRQQLGEAARKLVEDEYSWERIGQQLENAYQCAINGHTCASPSTRTGDDKYAVLHKFEEQV